MESCPFPILYDEPWSDEIFREWKDGNLRQGWAAEHPDLFDEFDLATNQPNKYCAEWYAAILLKQKRGMLSLISKFAHHGHKKHLRKQEVLRCCLTPEQHRFVITDKLILFGTRRGIAGWPDLFVYKPDYSEFFFCEVKGPKDRLSTSQPMVFDRLQQQTGIPVYMFVFHSIRSRRARGMLETKE